MKKIYRIDFVCLCFRVFAFDLVVKICCRKEKWESIQVIKNYLCAHRLSSEETHSHIGQSCEVCKRKLKTTNACLFWKWIMLEPIEKTYQKQNQLKMELSGIMVVINWIMDSCVPVLLHILLWRCFLFCYVRLHVYMYGWCRHWCVTLWIHVKTYGLGWLC